MAPDPDFHPRSTITQTANQAAPRRTVPAWIMSVLLHTTLFLLLALTVRVTSRGAAVEPDRTAGIVLARRVHDRIEYFEGEDRVEPNADTPSAISSPPPIASEELLPDAPDVDLPKSVGPLTVAGSADPNALPDANALVRSRPPSKQIGGSVQTSIFGVTGTGTKFVYVFDRSASMSQFRGRPLAAAKAELLTSLRELDDIHQFQIIFYNQRPAAFNPTGQSPRLWWGDERGTKLAERFMHSIVAIGGTEHLEPMKMALGLGPDVIFFLTDAQRPRLTAPELQQIRRLNSRYGASIHAIEFGNGPDQGGDNFLKRLARQNNGRHTYVDISVLATEP